MGVLLPHSTGTYSGICLGWGWGMSSYMRNVNATSNSITKPMQLLADGGGLYVEITVNHYCYNNGPP